MTYSSSTNSTTPQDGEYTGPSDSELLQEQTSNLRKLWLTCYLLCHRLHGGGHSTLSSLDTIRTTFISGGSTALEAQASCYSIMAQLQAEAITLIDAGDWSKASKYSVETTAPGPFADDAAAAAGGVAVGALYKVNGGTIAWRVS